jgi:DNA-binding GntR family transcriptional regulator
VALDSAVIRRNPRLRDQVYEALRRELRVGALDQGARLVEQDLARRLGVSRTPVREALFQLARDGLLVEHKRGYRLPKLALPEVIEILEIRLLLEPVAARQVALMASEAEIVLLGQSLEVERGVVTAPTASAFIDANMAFRDALLAPCPNRALTECAALYDDRVQALRVLTLNEVENRRATVGFHERIVAAVAAREPEAAARETRGLIEALRDYCEQAFGGGS